ncbi:unnamed protein product [Schistosoma margrebowiei]|uniref:Uncharacterized protein n=1 Tax=Schistosoma margrebowiei TaxID=48269 RepID=A0A183N5R3_9TREM|nr:unnamed protein product [Schistosoma margrebowiei]
MENDHILHESSINRTSNETAVIHDAPSDPEMSISETCPVVGSNPIVPETLCTNAGLSSSQKDDFLLNAHEIIALSAQKETENESSIIMKIVAPNVAHHSTIENLDESNYRDSLVLPENMSSASNNNQEPGAVLLNADYHSDPLSTSDVPHKFGPNISEDSNFNHLISIIQFIDNDIHSIDRAICNNNNNNSSSSSSSSNNNNSNNNNSNRSNSNNNVKINMKEKKLPSYVFGL